MTSPEGDVLPATSQFAMTEARTDGYVRLVLTGELDLAVAERLTEKLDSLRTRGESVVLDLSRLTFMDSTGIRVIVRMLRYSVSDGWNFQVDPEMCAQVTKVLELSGVNRLVADGRAK